MGALSHILRLLTLKRSNPVEDCPYSLAHGDVIAFPGAVVGQSDSIVPGSTLRARSVEPGLNVSSFHRQAK